MIPAFFRLIFLACCLFAAGCSQEKDAAFKSAPDFKAEIFHPARSSFKLSKINAEKPVLIVFWATWCPSCREEIPHVNETARKYAGRLAVVAVNVQEERANVAAFLKENAVEYPVILDESGAISDSFQVTALPSVLLLAKGGKIIYYGFSLPDRGRLEKSFST